MAERIADLFMDEPNPALAKVSAGVAEEVKGLLQERDAWATVQFAEFARYYAITGRQMAV